MRSRPYRRSAAVPRSRMGAGWGSVGVRRGFAVVEGGGEVPPWRGRDEILPLQAVGGGVACHGWGGMRFRGHGWREARLTRVRWGLRGRGRCAGRSRPRERRGDEVPFAGTAWGGFRRCGPGAGGVSPCGGRDEIPPLQAVRGGVACHGWRGEVGRVRWDCGVGNGRVAGFRPHGGAGNDSPRRGQGVMIPFPGARWDEPVPGPGRGDPVPRPGMTRPGGVRA